VAKEKLETPLVEDLVGRWAAAAFPNVAWMLCNVTDGGYSSV